MVKDSTSPFQTSVGLHSHFVVEGLRPLASVSPSIHQFEPPDPVTWQLSGATVLATLLPRPTVLSNAK